MIRPPCGPAWPPLRWPNPTTGLLPLVRAWRPPRPGPATRAWSNRCRGRGAKVIRVDDRFEASAAAERVRAIVGPVEPILVEGFVAGAEVAVEALLVDGVLEVLAVFDKPDPLDGPFFEETIYVTPSRQLGPILASVAATMTAATAALGLREGPVHAELRVGADGRVVVIEVAARSIGGLCARALRFGAGVSLEEIIVRHAVGAGLDGLRRETQASGVMMLPIRAAGVLHKVSGQAEALAVDGVVGVEITISAGRALIPLPEGDRYLGFVFARGPTPADVEVALRRAEAALDVVVGPAPEPVASAAGTAEVRRRLGR